MSQKVGREHFGEEIGETAEAKAERLIEVELKRLKWTERDLRASLKGHPKKVEMAVRLRRETAMTLSWVAHRLQMGTKTHLSHLLYWHEREAS